MVGLVITLLPTSIISRHGCRRSKWSPPSKWCSADGGWCGGGGAVVLRQGGDPALCETFRSPSKFTRGLNPTPSFSPKAETLALPWWSRSQGTRSHVTPRRARCYPVSARYSRVAVLCLPMRVEAHTPWSGANQSARTPRTDVQACQGLQYLSLEAPGLGGRRVRGGPSPPSRWRQERSLRVA